MGIVKLKENLLKLISKKDLSLEDLELMFVKIRLILEKLNIKHEYAQLNFYCNWIVHTEINRPTKVIDLILSLNQKVLIDYDLKKPLDIISILDPQKLKQELNNFFRKILKSDHIIRDEDYSQFFYNV